MPLKSSRRSTRRQHRPAGTRRFYKKPWRRSSNPIVKRAVAKAQKKVAKARKNTRNFSRPSFIPASCIIKTDVQTGYTNQSLFGSDDQGQSSHDWHIWSPLQLNRVAENWDGTRRTTNSLWARNTKYELEVLPSKECLTGFQMRVCYGYFKGDSNLGVQGLTRDNLSTIYPTLSAKLHDDKQHAGKSDFYWKGEQNWTFIPEQIYDENGSDDTPMGSEPMVALYKPKKFYINFNYNRKITYENADGDSQNGYKPFIAVQCMTMPNQNHLTRPQLPSSADHGTNPGPRVNARCATYFSDIH